MEQNLASVCLVVPSGVGGTLQYSHNLANALVDQGHEVLMVTALDCEMVDVPHRYRELLVFDRFTPHWKPLRAFIRSVRQMRPDIVHLQGAQRPEFYLLIYLVLRLITRARFVWTPQDILSNSKKSYHIRLLRFLYAKMDHVFVNAKQNRDVLRDVFAVPDTKVTVLPIPDLVAFARADLPAAMPPELVLDDQYPPILCFGMIEHRKGIGTLIEAFAKLNARCPEARLLIMGKPLIEVSGYIAAIRSYGIGHAAQLIDRYATFEEMNGVFNRAHHVVMAYHMGWNSGVLASAYGYGKPVIASNVGGFDEVVEDGVSGLLIAPKSVDELADAMERMLHDPALHATLTAGAIARSNDASWPRVAARTNAIYARIKPGQRP